MKICVFTPHLQIFTTPKVFVIKLKLLGRAGPSQSSPQTHTSSLFISHPSPWSTPSHAVTTLCLCTHALLRLVNPVYPSNWQMPPPLGSLFWHLPLQEAFSSLWLSFLWCPLSSQVLVVIQWFICPYSQQNASPRRLSFDNCLISALYVPGPGIGIGLSKKFCFSFFASAKHVPHAYWMNG